MPTEKSFIDYLNDILEEYEIDIEKCEQCIDCMECSIAEKQESIIWNNGAIDAIDDILTHIEDDEDEDIDIGDIDDETIRRADVFTAIYTMVNNPDNDCVRLRRSDKDGIAFDVYLEKTPIKGVDNQHITVSVSGD